MPTTYDMFTIQMQNGQNYLLHQITEKGGITDYEFHFSWTKENADTDNAFTVS